MLKKSRKNLIILVFLIILSAVIFGVYQVQMLAKAHSTFENYCAFRGCAKLLEKTDEYGVCQTASGQTIKIVKFDNRWFLDGDLPCGFLCF
jgi:hypothetical protein